MAIPGEKLINTFFTTGIVLIINKQFNNHCLNLLESKINNSISFHLA